MSPHYSIQTVSRPLLLTLIALTKLTDAIVYPDGNVCISILHTPGDDPTMYEQASERWSPVQSVEKVILSDFHVSR